MPARNHMPRHRNDERGFHVGHPASLSRGHARIPFHDIDEELVMTNNEFHRLYDENHHLLEENLAFRREIAAANEEIHILSQAIPKLRADKELEGRELIQRGLKLEAELRALEPIKAEATKLQAKAQELDAMTQELSAQVQTLTQNFKKMLGDHQQIKALKTEIDGLHKELVRTRTAYDYERKTNADQLHQMHGIQMNLVSMARQVEKLRELEMSTKGPGAGTNLAMSPSLMNPSPVIGYAGLYGDGNADKKAPNAAGLCVPNELNSFPRH